VDLVLFGTADAAVPERVLTLTADDHLTGDWWHVHLAGVGHGQVYGWKVFGEEHDATAGKVLLDPWGRAVTGLTTYDRAAARRPGDSTATALRSVVVDPHRYDWEGDAGPPAPAREIIYEAHPAALTRHPSSGVDADLRGTFAGVARQAEYLKDLGVTTVELMPVACFDPQDAPAGLVNYWGYSPVSWFAPHPGWAADRSPTGPVDEFRGMVKALHRAGLQVMLDVVVNHTAEAGPDGPVLCWRGLSPRTWYLHGPDGAPIDVTGCGNTVHAHDAVVRRNIVDALCWWTEHMHVDGFRFDLAGALARDQVGRPLDRPPLLDDLAAEPRLAGVRLVAEPWDAGGLHLVGRLPGKRWGFWNDRFRDDVRCFLRGDTGKVESLMARITGSRDLLPSAEGGPRQVVNFFACHDGFCLADLVTYERKRNLENGEDNRDGSDHNLSWNCGHEGPDAPAAVREIRRRQQRNFLCLLMLSHGTPLLLAGDESGHTRRGNNNPWCQDNELNWLDWSPEAVDQDLLRFVRTLVGFSREVALLQENRFWRATGAEGPGDISWHGQLPGKPDWRPNSRRIAYTLEDTVAPQRVHVMLNASEDTAPFTPPPPRLGNAWRVIVHTGRPSPQDIQPPETAPPLPDGPLDLPPHAVAVLLDTKPVNLM
jgi:glycogen operon protein